MIIAIYNDSPILGGHELVTIRIANTLSEQYQVIFYYFHVEIGKRLSHLVDGICLAQAAPAFLCGVRSYSPSIIKDLSAKFREKKINIVIVAQGAIEHGLRGMWAGKNLGIPVVSYIPLCFPMTKTGGRFGALRDLINLYFYRAFDEFITISEEQKNYITTYAPNKKVHIVNNPFSLANENIQILPRAGFNIGIIGRVEFRHKGQDKLLGLAKKMIEDGLEFKFIICGDGPDLARLKIMVKNSNIDNYFDFRGWIQNHEKIYEQIDLVLSTSNYEGVPLVLIETVAKGIPFFGPREGIFLEYLPERLLYRDDEDFVRKLIAQQEDYNSESFILLLETIREKTSLKHSNLNYRRELFSCLNELESSISKPK